MTTPTDDELLALAKKVPQGKWIAVRCAYSHKPDGFRIESGDDVFHPRAVPDNDGILHIWIEFAAYVEEYIAAANPAAIIALIERHRAEVERLTRKAEHDMQSVIRSANALASQLEHQRDAAESALAAAQKGSDQQNCPHHAE